MNGSERQKIKLSIGNNDKILTEAKQIPSLQTGYWFQLKMNSSNKRIKLKSLISQQRFQQFTKDQVSIVHH